MPSTPTLADVDRYIKGRAVAERPGTPEEGRAWQKRLAAMVAEHPDLPAAAARVEAALAGTEPATGAPFVDWLRAEIDRDAPAAGPTSPAWFERLARGVGAGMVAASRVMDDEAADGAPLAANQVDVRVQQLSARDELVIRVRVRSRTARRQRSEIARRIVAELDAFLDP